MPDGKIILVGALNHLALRSKNTGPLSREPPRCAIAQQLRTDCRDNDTQDLLFIAINSTTAFLDATLSSDLAGFFFFLNSNAQHFFLQILL